MDGTDKITEKVYCYDHPSAYANNNHDALAIAAMANRNNGCSPAEMMAAMNGNGMNNWANNPFIYLVFMMMFGGGNWFGNRNNAVQDAEVQARLNQLSTQMQDGNNTSLLMDAIKGNATAVGQLASNLNCDFNQLQQAVCGVQSAIQQVGGAVGFSAEKVINAANLGDLNIVQQLKDCCCTTQQNIVKMGYESQLGQKDIVNTIQTQTLAMQQGHNNITQEILRNLATITAQNQQDKCDILRSGEMNTQRIVDVLNQHWQADLQQRYNDARLELSQQRQNAELIAALKTTTTTT